MEDKRLKEKFNYASDQDLNFTKEDRNKVFDQIYKLQKNKNKKKTLVSSKKTVPITVSLLVIGLCLFLILPSMLSGNINEEATTSDFNKESSTSVASDAGIDEEKVLTTLITVKSKEMDNRIYLNLLISHSTDKKMMKVVSLPNDTYAPISENNDGTTVNDKLLFAYNFGGAENVRKSVSKLFDLPINFYAVIDLETFSALIDSINGIEYELQEDIQVRAITQAAFEFQKGANHLNGDGVVALMMAATEPNNLDEGNFLKLMNAVMKKMGNEISSTQLKELLTQIETNTSLDHMLEKQTKIESVKQVSLSGGIIDDATTINNTEGKHIYRFEEDFLSAVSQELTTFK